MCGICGVIGFSDPNSRADMVRAMMAQMRHRGPDDDGLFVGDCVALGMRRLSIIDIEGGHQPIFNEDRSVAAVFNGEIYNFRQLRRRLETFGHTFHSHSDSEVIVHAYEQWSDECVCHLEGMFAFAIADYRPTKDGSCRVLLARDRLGIKPLYYALAGETLVFASEVRSLLASGIIEPRLSPAALRSYLLFGSAIEPMTLVDGVYSLPPGHRLSICPTRGDLDIRPEPYWEFAASAQQTSLATPKLDRISAAESLRSLLQASVDSHLTADVPVGVFLSSGIDSTALVALAAQQTSSVHTVTVVFPEQEFSEGEVARRTAQRFATNHQELELSGDDMVARLAEAVNAFDEPSMDGINTYFVSWAARQAGLKVALSGLGGDELFGGYTTFRTTPKAGSVANLARRVPRDIRSLLASGAETVSERFSRSNARQKITALWRDPDYFPHPYFYTRLLFTPKQMSALLNREADVVLEPWQETLARITAQSEKLDDFNAVSSLECQCYMTNTLLRDTDSMSMAHSLEVRVPFLDTALVEFVSRLPGSLKTNNGTPKSLLVEAMGSLLPPEVVGQRKRTFTLPWEHWLRGPLKEQVATELNNIAEPLREYLDATSVKNVWNSFLQGKTSWSRVWSLFVLSRWSRLHLTDAALEPLSLAAGRAGLQARVRQHLAN